VPRFSDAFGLENEFNGFADRVVAGLGPRRVVRGVFYLLNGIAHGHGEARAATSGYKTGTVFGRPCGIAEASVATILSKGGNSRKLTVILRTP